MAETIEIVISVILLFSVFLGLYRKFLRGKLKLPMRLVSALKPGQTPTAWKSRFSGARGSIIKLAVIALIILASFWQMIGWPDRTYGPEEFKKEGICSGGCVVTDGYVELSNGGSMSLNGTEKMGIGRVVVVPESLPQGTEVRTLIGPYEFLAYSDDIHYIGKIYVNGEDITYNPSLIFPGPAKKSNVGAPIVVRANNFDRCPFGLCGYPEVPDMEVGEWLNRQPLINSLRYESDPPVKGKVAVKSAPGQTIKIKEVRIYYGSLRQRISHLIFG